MSQLYWKKLQWGIILWSFTTIFTISVRGDQSKDNQIAELKVALEALRQNNAALQQKLQEKEQETASLRSKYVELLMQSNQTVGDVTNLLLSGSHLIHSSEKGADEENETVRMLQVIGVVRRRMVQFARSLADCERSVAVALETCKASSITCSEVNEKFSQVKRELNSCLQPMALSEKDDLGGTGQSCAVVLSDPTLKIAVVDGGFLHGLQIGMKLELKRGDSVVATLVVVQCRPLKSAIYLVDGQFEAVVPGSLLNRVSTISKRVR